MNAFEESLFSWRIVVHAIAAVIGFVPLAGAARAARASPHPEPSQ